MTTHTASRVVPASLESVFDLVADVEAYPEFLSLWQEARIIERQPDSYITEQVIGLGPVRERFRSKTLLSRHSHIEIMSLDKLFRSFLIRWDFVPVAKGTRILIALKWEVRSPLLQSAIVLLLPGVATSMVEAFEKRAKETLA
ncbi:MAG: type II toxin-antitoxin system RatA family toxin [Hyphomicrobiales bacterium]|nr:type II toxin-antitoxin system RatA family toxin [Hyphomicrobiales bacterium]